MEARREAATQRLRYIQLPASHITLVLRSSFRFSSNIAPHVALLVRFTFLFDLFVFSQFTEYLMAFCIQNEKAHPNSKEVNLAFTQQITYGRVKADRKVKIVDMARL